ncbi:GtrA family protein [Neobacillus niacini]|uniref:GtrA family protein n=1 Tax=Neobacillus niacini TaxID=86668 RepID=UPI0005EED4DA|nr:GtrA family protein [Neobacillus niacini]
MKDKRQIVNYLIFGVLTTFINIVTYGFLTKALHIDYKLATTIAWLVSVLFAFITNKLYVFNSKELTVVLLIKELMSFLFFRLISYGIDIALMILLVEWLEADDLFSKVISNVVVVIINYVASKQIIFNNR